MGPQHLSQVQHYRDKYHLVCACPPVTISGAAGILTHAIGIAITRGSMCTVHNFAYVAFTTGWFILYYAADNCCCIIRGSITVNSNIADGVIANISGGIIAGNCSSGTTCPARSDSAGCSGPTLSAPTTRINSVAATNVSFAIFVQLPIICELYFLQWAVYNLWVMPINARARIYPPRTATA